MPQRTSLTRRIDLTKKFHNWNWVVITTQGKVAFVFRDSVQIDDTNNNKAQVAGHFPTRIFFYILSCEALEAIFVQNHHRTFRTECPVIIGGAERRCFFTASCHHYVMVMFILQRRMAERAPLLVHQTVRPEHSSGDSCVKLFHTIISSSRSRAALVLQQAP
jgi:hypothetical protein